jgi:hypothetical protein
VEVDAIKLLRCPMIGQDYGKLMASKLVCAIRPTP